MADVTRWSQRMRLLTVCLLLAGLFGMHGNPAIAPLSCHGAMPQAAATRMAPAPAHHTGDGSRSSASQSSGGQLCLALPVRARGWTAAALLIVLLLPGPFRFVPLRLRASGGGSRHRGPPLAGRALLADLCVARQ